MGGFRGNLGIMEILGVLEGVRRGGEGRVRMVTWVGWGGCRCGMRDSCG